MPNEQLVCGACGASTLQDVPEFPSLPRVTSDCKPFRDGGRLAVCSFCGVGQAIPDDQWFAEIEEIYAKYDIYYQSGGQEQHVFDKSTGSMRPRSDVLVERLDSMRDISRGGKLLDAGCGNGETLKRFAKLPQWELHGLDINDRNLPRLAAIPGFSRLHTCPPAEVSETFDLITLIHTLEHIPAPSDFLRDLRGKLRHGGLLFIQVPDASANAFDYVVADHLLHFSPEALACLLRRTGFGNITVFTDWVAKEISLLASAGKEDGETARSGGRGSKEISVGTQVAWLKDVIEMGRDLAATGTPFGLFGSSIASTWLWSKVSDHVTFFVEEDPSRIGRMHFGCPILSPDQVPDGATVFLPLARAVAEAIHSRLRNSRYALHLPPSLTATVST